MSDYTNADGLTRHYGPQDVRDQAHQTVDVGGGVKQLVVDVSFDALPGFDADASGGSTPDSFSDAAARIPALSGIVSARFLVTTPFAGGTSYTVGLYTKAGAAIDADGLLTAAQLATANIDAAGDFIVGSGALVEATVGAADAYLLMAASGTFTAGKGRLVIEYIEATEA
jgi:hypothetical protein